MIEISVGRASTNDIPINHESVSAHHAMIKMSSDNSIKIRDLNSSNGTILNGQHILESSLKSTDELLLGSQTVEMTTFFSLINNIYTQKKTDFSIEYDAIMREFKEYQTAKDKIQNPSPLPIYLRIGLTMGAIIVLIVTDIIPPRYQIYLLTIVGLVALVPSLMAPSQSKKVEKLDLLKVKYEDILVCPKCKNRMINQSVSYWKDRRKCINEKCDATYIA